MTGRIGIGFDLHRLKEGRKLIIGGLEIPFEKGLDGHSDADILIHAIIDAMLGAIGSEDIGTHFPPDDNTYKNIDSKILLAKTLAILKQKNFKIINVDTVILAEKPKMKDYIPQMKLILAHILEIDTSQIAIKAKTMEGCGFIGQNEAMAAKAVILIDEI